MFVGNFKGVSAIPLNAEGTAPAGESPSIKVADNRFKGAEDVFRDSYYNLFVSAGNCCNGPDTDWVVYHAVPRSDLKLTSGAQRREGMIDRIVWANGCPKSVTARSGGAVNATLMITAPADEPYTGQVWVTGASSETPVEMGTVTVWKTGQVTTPGLGGMSSSFGNI